MAEDPSKDQPLDATSKFYVRMADGPDLFLLVSGAGNLRLVDRAVGNIRAARAAVSPAIAGHILDAVAEGDEAGTSYAVWPEMQDFPTAHRLQRFIARRRHAGPILDWAEGFARETLREADPATFDADLAAVEDEDGFAEPMRLDARRARDRIRDGLWRPMHCFHHGDLWLGNVLLPEEGRGPSFYVIDWAGMERDGYPFFDLARILPSLKAGSRTSRDRIARLCGHVGCAPQDAVSYALAALGHVGRNLEHFAPEAYRAMAVEVHGFMKAHRPA